LEDWRTGADERAAGYGFQPVSSSSGALADSLRTGTMAGPARREPRSMSYPASSPDRADYVLERRGPKNRLDPSRAYGAFVEEEPDVTESTGGAGAPVRVATVLLANRECPWRCVFCDLWRNTLDATVPSGAIEAQIRGALETLPPSRWIKLYNAGSFF